MAAGDPGTPKRNYSAIAIESSILYSIPAQSTGASYTSFIVASNSGWPTVPFTLIIDPDTSKEEVVTATALSGAATYTITRGENSTASVAHSAGAVVRHGVSGREFTLLLVVLMLTQQFFLMLIRHTFTDCRLAMVQSWVQTSQ